MRSSTPLGASLDWRKQNNRRSLETAAENHINHLRRFFGFDRAVGQDASVATVNRKVATLRRMFSLAIENGKLCRKPVFKMLGGERVRQGFVEHGDFLRLLDCLPQHLRPFVEFLYYSGWRKGAARLETLDPELSGWRSL
jgi:integrase